MFRSLYQVFHRARLLIDVMCNRRDSQSGEVVDVKKIVTYVNTIGLLILDRDTNREPVPTATDSFIDGLSTGSDLRLYEWGGAVQAKAVNPGKRQLDSDQVANKVTSISGACGGHGRPSYPILRSLLFSSGVPSVDSLGPFSLPRAAGVGGSL